MAVSGNPLARVRLGPVALDGGVVVLRRIRLDDYAEWRRIRLRDRERIEPYWHSSDLDWSQRHTQRQWAHECVIASEQAWSGRRLPLAIEIDGRFAGQIELGSIDRRCGTAEMAIWLDARQARKGFAQVAAAMVFDYAFGPLGLTRVTAPISSDNAPPARTAAAVGLRREAVLAEYFDAGGGRRDHDLWAATRSTAPAAGYLDRWLDGPDTPRAAAATWSGRPPAARRSPGGVLLARTVLRHGASRLWHLLDGLRHGEQVRLADPEHAEVLLRSRGWSDRRSLRGAVDMVRGRSIRSADGLVLVVEAGGVPIGACGLRDLDMFDRNITLFVQLDPHRADVRLLTTTIRLLLGYAAEHGIERVALTVEVGDSAGAAAAQAAGMRFEGTAADLRVDGREPGDYQLWAYLARHQ
ncbi:GNAT family N-acetyltransferase [Nocardia sp. NPDC052566]|uniref:GNAT family N-acetyltransferase n=1 Tax=Nocardia sp. NPDC052566 TaxID=3364330 RepID=UPI0037C8D054